MKKKVEFSQIVRKKMKNLKKSLADRFDEDTAKKGLRLIVDSAKDLAAFPEKGEAVSDLFDVDTDFRILYVNHNYLFYYFEDDKIIVAEMFDEREDFMYKLFGISSESHESLDYWDE